MRVVSSPTDHVYYFSDDGQFSDDSDNVHSEIMNDCTVIIDKVGDEVVGVEVLY